MDCLKKNNLITEEVFYILNTLEDNNFPSRIVGGAVRNFLMNKTINDIDIASSANPKDIVNIFTSNGIRVLPTGIQYGTVTLLLNHRTYEITSLRKDTKTFGRRAEVSFSTSFEEDSLRRDFTMNAIYMDKNGCLYDFHNGIDDIKRKNIRFIGDALTRIKEDYLRIFRYFRFVATYGDYKFNNKYLTIINSQKQKTSLLSCARIYSELLKIFTVQDSYKVVDYMYEILNQCFGLKSNVLKACQDLDIFHSLSAEDRLSMILIFSDPSKIKKYNFPKRIKGLTSINYAYPNSNKALIKNSNKNQRFFLISYLATKYYLDKLLSRENAKKIFNELIDFCNSDYADFNMKSTDINNSYLLNEQTLQHVMKSTKDFWKSRDEVSRSECIKFAENYINELKAGKYF